MTAAADLAALVRESVSADAAREVLHLRLGALQPEHRRPHHRRLMREALDAALSATRSRVFDLPNGDLVAVARAPCPALDAARDALLRSLDAAATAAVRRLRLPDEAAQVLSAAAESLGLEPASHALPPAAGGTFGSADLAAAERALAAADLEPLTDVQRVCRLDPDGAPPEILWTDRRIAWPALAALLLPGRDLATAPGLARRLAHLAEARLLAELARPAAQMEWRPTGLTLSPATLAGGAFARFEAALPAGRRAEVTIGLRAADLLAEPALAARLLPALRARGFRLALDDAEAATLALLAPAHAAFDVLRLRWTPTLPEAPHHAFPAPERLVLTGVDRPAAIAWGWEAGLRLFQGPLIERRRPLSPSPLAREGRGEGAKVTTSRPSETTPHCPPPPPRPIPRRCPSPPRSASRR